MNREEREYLKYREYLHQLDVALETGEIEKLPKKITPSVITNALVNAVSFKEYKIEKAKLEEIANKLINDIDYISSAEFADAIYLLLKENYPNKSEYEIEHKKIDVIFNNDRLGWLISAVDKYKEIYNRIYFKNKITEHRNAIVKIASTRNIEELPRIGLSNVNQRISKDLYELFNKEQLKTIYTGAISKSLLDGKGLNDDSIRNAIEYLCESKQMIEPYNSMNIDEKVNYILELLKDDYELRYLVEEIIAKEFRIKQIYKLDHEDIMDQIEDATRISEMPSNLSISRITSYLSGNSMVYPKGKVIPGADFLNLAQLLLSGKTMTDTEVSKELMEIMNKNYEDLSVRVDAYRLLHKKLSSLPKLYYYVEEVKAGMQRQQEFIARGTSNVNVYFIQNPKSPIEGGKFYNCYISRASDLNLEETLPLDIDKIVPPNTDIDAIEWYVRKHADKTFKAAGGIILNKDESIGNVKVFRPNDGKLGITPEEKSKYEQLEELSKKLKVVTEISKKAKEEYLKTQTVIDEQINTIQEAMNLLIDDEMVLKKKREDK